MQLPQGTAIGLPDGYPCILPQLLDADTHLRAAHQRQVRYRQACGGRQKRQYIALICFIIIVLLLIDKNVQRIVKISMVWYHI